MKVKAQKWLWAVIAEGMQGLLALRLKNAPPEDTIKVVLNVWLIAIQDYTDWTESIDTERIQKAFVYLYGTRTTWPSPYDFLTAMPKRPAPKALPLKPISEEQRLRNQQRLKTWLNNYSAKSIRGGQHVRN